MWNSIWTTQSINGVTMAQIRITQAAQTKQFMPQFAIDSAVLGETAGTSEEAEAGGRKDPSDDFVSHPS